VVGGEEGERESRGQNGKRVMGWGVIVVVCVIMMCGVWCGSATAGGLCRLGGRIIYYGGQCLAGGGNFHSRVCNLCLGASQWSRPPQICMVVRSKSESPLGKERGGRRRTLGKLQNYIQPGGDRDSGRLKRRTQRAERRKRNGRTAAAEEPAD
jgi:hypothetical protein